MQAKLSTPIRQDAADSATTRSVLQEDKYDFPYHHVPMWGPDTFQHYRVMPPAYEYASYCRYVIRRLGDRAFESILDVGCGDGRLAREIRAAYPNARVVGIDVSVRAIAFARALVPDCEFISGDLCDPDQIASRFDVVTMIEVLEHIEVSNVDEILRAVARRLCDGGRFILTVPATNVPVSPQHVRHFDESELSSALDPVFEIDDLVYLNRKALSEQFLYRLMTNRFFVLSGPRLLGRILHYYERNLLPADARNARRLLAVCGKKPDAASHR